MEKLVIRIERVYRSWYLAKNKFILLEQMCDKVNISPYVVISFPESAILMQDVVPTNDNLHPPMNCGALHRHGYDNLQSQIHGQILQSLRESPFQPAQCSLS